MNGSLAPIVGYAIDSIRPTEPAIHLIGAFVLLPLDIVGAVLWIIIFAAIAKDQHYKDPNYLLIISLGIGDCIIITAALLEIFPDLFNVWIGYKGCAIMAIMVLIGFASSGLSVLLISLDRWLQLCHGVEKSRRNTLIMLSTSWGFILAGVSLAIIPSLPNSIMLVAKWTCVPDVTSSDPVFRIWVSFFLGIVYAVAVGVVFCYSSIYSMYTKSLTKNGKKMTKKMSENAKKLLKKFAFLSGSFIVTVLPLTILLTKMHITKEDIPWQSLAPVLIFAELIPVLNPVLLYLLDARLKNTVNEMLGIMKPKPTKIPSAMQLKVIPDSNLVGGDPALPMTVMITRTEIISRTEIRS